MISLVAKTWAAEAAPDRAEKTSKQMPFGETAIRPAKMQKATEDARRIDFFERYVHVSQTMANGRSKAPAVTLKDYLY